MAPEILLNRVNPEHKTKLDVYSFGIIMYEVFFEAIPYSIHTEQFDSIIALGNRIESGMRPEIPEYQVQDLAGSEKRFLKLMKDCWSENPEDRPTFDEIFAEFIKMG